MLQGQEYGVDIINDLDGRFCNAIVKKKLAMRAGETDIAETVDEPLLFDEAERLGKITGHIANMDCDFFLVNGKPYVLEMNARFGGGYPFSHVAGCNLPQAIMNWIQEKTVSSDMLQAKSGVLTYKELVLTTKK
jgi:carbamoyl-phosphate synthase large subunit